MFRVVDILRSGIDKSYVRPATKKRELERSTTPNKLKPPRSNVKQKEQISSLDYYRNLINLYSVKDCQTEFSKIDTHIETIRLGKSMLDSEQQQTACSLSRRLAIQYAIGQGC